MRSSLTSEHHEIIWGPLLLRRTSGRRKNLVGTSSTLTQSSSWADIVGCKVLKMYCGGRWWLAACACVCIGGGAATDAETTSILEPRACAGFIGNTLVCSPYCRSTYGQIFQNMMYKYWQTIENRVHIHTSLSPSLRTLVSIFL